MNKENVQVVKKFFEDHPSLDLLYFGLYECSICDCISCVYLSERELDPKDIGIMDLLTTEQLHTHKTNKLAHFNCIVSIH